MIPRKKHKSSPEKLHPFDNLPEDLVIIILSKLASSSSSPADFISPLLTCKRLNQLGLHPLVLSKAGQNTLAVKAKNWSANSHRFLKQCVNSGNVEACYTLGMIRFYCLKSRGSGASLMAKAALKSHAPALYSLAVMQFNGSGGSKDDKRLRDAVSLCARAAKSGHINALREIGHCLQDGYGVSQNISLGRRLLVQANACELASVFDTVTLSLPKTNKLPSHDQRTCLTGHYRYHHTLLRCPMISGSGTGTGIGCSLLSDVGCKVPESEIHPVNLFMTEWFDIGHDELNHGLRLCSHYGCGRPETRPHEFRRCGICGLVNYCSRVCQALDWKFHHKIECVPIERWVGGNGTGGGDVVFGGHY